MNERNAFTYFLFFSGIISMAWVVAFTPQAPWLAMLPILVLIVVLDFFPIKLLSGDDFNIGIVGFLVLLMNFSLEACLIGILFSTLAFNLRRYRSFARIRWFRFFSTLGMYALCAVAAYGVVVNTASLPVYGQVFAAALVFEVLNVALLAGIFKSVQGIPLLHESKTKGKELLVPIAVCTVAVPQFVYAVDSFELLREVIYTALLIGFLIVFSNRYLQQVILRKKTSEQFIGLFESKISAQMEGHGRRVGIICEQLLYDIPYPKAKRNVLVQAAILHDVGKALLPLHVFHKRGALSLSEEREYQSHPEKGAAILQSFLTSEDASCWVRHHHERYDGRGFPSGWKATDIPLESRMIAVANAMDHLMTKHQDDNAVFELLLEQRSKSLDPYVLSFVTPSVLSSIREAIGERGGSAAGRNEGEASAITYADTVESPAEGAVASEGELTAGENTSGENRLGSVTLLRYVRNNRWNGSPPPWLEVQLAYLAEQALEQGDSFHEIFAQRGELYEAHFYPEASMVVIFLIDMTPVQKYREGLHRQILESYKDVVETVSNGKIAICLTRHELERRLGQRLHAMSIESKGDVAASRNLVMDYVDNGMVDSKRLMSMKLAVSESVTNMIKHATEGKVAVYASGRDLQVYVTDKGSGIPLHELPKTVLVAGYSSKRSLGKGFTLMFGAADRITLHTCSRGTSLLLEFANVRAVSATETEEGALRSSEGWSA